MELTDIVKGSPSEAKIVCSGMVGAKQGWKEAPYRDVPCVPLSSEGAVISSFHDARIDVRILPGLRQSEPADVMRGEETQFAGYIAGRPQIDGTICLP